MEITAALLKKAQQRAQELGLPYTGALLPVEAIQVLQKNQGLRESLQSIPFSRLLQILKSGRRSRI